MKQLEPQIGYGDGMELKNAPEDFARAYRDAGTAEARAKAQLFELRNGVLTGVHLDRRLFVREAHFVLSAAKDHILDSGSLSVQAKHALLNRLATCVEFQVDEKPSERADPPIPTTKPPEWSDYQFQRLREGRQTSGLKLRRSKIIA